MDVQNEEGDIASVPVLPCPLLPRRYGSVDSVLFLAESKSATVFVMVNRRTHLCVC